MAKKALKKLEEQLNCAICLDTYTDPKLLQCFHIYCRDCLVRLVVRDQQGQLSLTCPTCRQATPIPANGVTGLQSAFQVNHLLKILEEHKKSKDADQEDIQVAMAHPVSSKQCCSVHDGKELELYCESCGELICSHCVFRGQKHHSHEYDLISSCFEKYKEEITPSLEPVRKQLKIITEAMAQLDKNCEEISDQRADIEANIHYTAQRLCEVIDVRKTELIHQLQQMTRGKLKNLASQKDQMETILAQLGSCLDFLQESLKTNNQGEVLKMKMGIMKQVKELATPYERNILKSVTGADIEFSVSPEVASMCQNYGQLLISDPSKFLATGEALKMAEVGEKSTVIVEAIDDKASPCKVPTESLKCELVSEITGITVQGCVVKRGQNKCEINYHPTVKGRHQLHIKINNQQIQGSPFIVTVRAPVEKRTPIQTIGDLNEPFGVAINEKKELIVTESSGHCISIFSPSGDKLQSFGTHGSGPGQFNYPRRITVDGDQNIFVVDTFNHRIQKFTPTGQFLAAVGDKDGALFYKPKDIAFNARNNKLYVVDQNRCVSILNYDLTTYGTFGKRGNGKGQFNNPWGVACDNAGKVYVADTFNHRI